MFVSAAALSIISLAISAELCVDKLEWSTANGQVLVNGVPLVLKGINYHGFETEHFAPLGLTHHNLDNILDVIKKNNFNAIQIPFSMEMVRAAERGLLVVLSNNQFVGNASLVPPELWYDSQYSEQLVIDIWKTLIARYRNQWNVFAIDLKNEPNGWATWGNSNRKTNWNRAAERMINSFSAFNELYFVDCINWGNDLAGAEEFPISKWFPVMIGEWAGDTDPASMDYTWNGWMIEWLRKMCITNFIYWSLDPQSQYTIGLFEDDWITPNPRKLELLDRLQPHPTKFEARNGKICITKGAFPERHCQIPLEREDEKAGTQAETPSIPAMEQEAVAQSQSHKELKSTEAKKDLPNTTTSTLPSFSM